jgi:hypothetical protein
MTEPVTTDDAILFRSRKKRKVYRQRPEDDEDAAIAEGTSPPAQSLDDLIAQAGAEADELSVAEILRLRKQRKPREGVAFTSGNTTRDGEGQLVVHQEAAAPGPVAGLSKFASQTGFSGEVNNKHM